MKLRALLICLILTAVPITLRADPVYRITGTVVSSRDGSPVPFCRLRVTPMAGQKPSPATNAKRIRPDRTQQQADPDPLLADAHGRFSLEVAGPGAWDLTAVARNYHAQNYDAHEGYSSAIVLTQATPSLSITFRLQPDAAITGTILDEAGEPVAEGQVVVENVQTDQAAGFAQSDDRGHYEVSGLSPGQYKLRVQARPWYTSPAGAGRLRGRVQPAAVSTSSLDPSLDLVYPITWFGGSDDRRTAETITLAGGETRQADFHLQPLPAVHLTVPRTDQPEDPGTGANRWTGPNVTLVSREGFGEPAGSIMTTSGTSWNIGGLGPGTYQIRMPAPIGSPATDIRQLTVLPGSSGAIDLSTARSLVNVGLVASGTANLPPLVFTDLSDLTTHSALVSGFGRRGRSNDEDDGSRSIALLPGQYRISVASGSNAYLVGVAAVGAEVTDTTVRIGTGNARLTLTFADGRADLSGIARTANQPVPGAMVLLVPAAEPFDPALIQRDQTNTDGSFLITAIPPGRYILVAIDHGWTVNWRDPSTLTPYLLHGMPLEVKPAARATQDLEAVEP